MRTLFATGPARSKALLLLALLLAMIAVGAPLAIPAQVRARDDSCKWTQQIPDPRGLYLYIYNPHDSPIWVTPELNTGPGEWCARKTGVLVPGAGFLIPVSEKYFRWCAAALPPWDGSPWLLTGYSSDMYGGPGHMKGYIFGKKFLVIKRPESTISPESRSKRS